MSETPTPPTTPALKPGEYWVQCPDGSWTIARVLNWWHATNRTTAAHKRAGYDYSEGEHSCTTS